MCECWIHRYHVCHVIVGDNQVYDHSQGTWNSKLKTIEPNRLIDFPTTFYVDGMTAKDMRNICHKCGGSQLPNSENQCNCEPF